MGMGVTVLVRGPPILSTPIPPSSTSSSLPPLLTSYNDIPGQILDEKCENDRKTVKRVLKLTISTHFHLNLEVKYYAMRRVKLPPLASSHDEDEDDDVTMMSNDDEDDEDMKRRDGELLSGSLDVIFKNPFENHFGNGNTSSSSTSFMASLPFDHPYSPPKPTTLDEWERS